MSTINRAWFSQFRLPARGTVIALGMLSASLTPYLRFWILPLLAATVIVSTFWSPWLKTRATPRLILVVALGPAILAIESYGTFTFVSATYSVLPDYPALRSASMIVAVAAVLVLLFAGRRIYVGSRLQTIDWAIIGVWMAGSGAATIILDPNAWTDVWELHRDAGFALVNGFPPYEGLAIPNPMDWFPKGSFFNGYVYPPVVLYSFGLVDYFLGDSRWVSVISGVVMLIAVRRLSTDATSDALAVLVLMTPGWPLMVQMGWTEPLSVAILAAALASTGRLLRPLLLGFFIASKQYLLFWALPLTVSWIRDKRGILAITGLTALGLYLVGFLHGAGGYLQWAFIFHLTAPDAPVGAGLSGLARTLFDYPLSIPTWLSAGIGVFVGVSGTVAKPRSENSAILAATLMLYAIFLTGSQAFPNYWFLVLGALTLCSMALHDKPSAIASQDRRPHADVDST